MQIQVILSQHQILSQLIVKLSMDRLLTVKTVPVNSQF